MISVNFFGAVTTEDGIGMASRKQYETFLRAGIKTNLICLSRPVSKESNKGFKFIDPNILINSKASINYFHFSARWAKTYFQNVSIDLLKNFYNIGYFVCEVPAYNPDWIDNFDYFHEIWTASRFCHDSISKVCNIPVHVVPHTLDKYIPSSESLKMQKEKASLGDSFVFLTIANVFSDIKRKNITGVIDAFIKAFPIEQNSKVKLIVKLTNFIGEEIEEKNIVDKVSIDKRIILITKHYSAKEIDALYEKANVYISLHRAEGWGLTISDALLRGIPCIYTNYSGNVDFCDKNSGIAIDFKLVNVGENRLRYRSSDIWADPNIEDAADAMREIYSNFEYFYLRASLSRENLSSKFNPIEVGKIIKKRIEDIDQKMNELKILS